MPRIWPSVVVASAVALCALAPSPAGAQEPASPPQPPVCDIQISGAKEVSVHDVEGEVPAHVGEPFATTVDEVSHAVEQLYRDEGFTFARAKTTFDASTGLLSISIDEGVI